ncbi:MAG: UMP kinase [Gammaproteobacteria bacterium AqS3]|nr:UMP kinase [Gammaproteobacteria bacterium AqS3]
MSVSAAKPRYEKILIKLSGEGLAGEGRQGIDPELLDAIALQLGQLRGIGVKVSAVIGGGNLFRGEGLQKFGLNRIAGDHIGMLATIMNGIALRDALERKNIPAALLSSIGMEGIVERYDQRTAKALLESGNVVLFVGGIGNPLFTTDTSACLRAIEIEADLVLKATQVDGVYSSDPAQDPDAELYEQLDFATAIDNQLGIMDLTALCLLRDFDIPLRVFSMQRLENICDIVLGKSIGTLVGGQSA